MDGKDRDGLHFKKLASIFQVLVPTFNAKPKLYHGLLYLQKIDWCISPKFHGNVFGSSKG